MGPNTCVCMCVCVCVCVFSFVRVYGMFCLFACAYGQYFFAGGTRISFIQICGHLLLFALVFVSVFDWTSCGYLVLILVNTFTFILILICHTRAHEIPTVLNWYYLFRTVLIVLNVRLAQAQSKKRLRGQQDDNAQNHCIGIRVRRQYSPSHPLFFWTKSKKLRSAWHRHWVWRSHCHRGKRVFARRGLRWVQSERR